MGLGKLDWKTGRDSESLMSLGRGFQSLGAALEWLPKWCIEQFVLFLLKLRPDPENGSALSLQTKPKAGRRRWGHSTGLLKGDDWEDYEDNQLMPLGGKAHFSMEKSKQGAEAASRFLPFVMLFASRCPIILHVLSTFYQQLKNKLWRKFVTTASTSSSYLCRDAAHTPAETRQRHHFHETTPNFKYKMYTFKATNTVI